MRRETTFAALTLGVALSAACGGADQASSDGPGCYVQQGTFAETQDRPSPLRVTTVSLGDRTALLCYGAPSARGRAVMGALVPWGEPWRVGANEPTTLHIDAPIEVGGVPLRPGAYSLYAVPGEEEWEFFVNSNWERWGIPIDAAVRRYEVGSFTVVPERTDDMVETLTYSWEPAPDGRSGQIVLEWETTRLRFAVRAGA